MLAARGTGDPYGNSAARVIPTATVRTPSYWAHAYTRCLKRAAFTPCRQSNPTRQGDEVQAHTGCSTGRHLAGRATLAVQVIVRHRERACAVG
jgi:hypothetical protein